MKKIFFLITCFIVVLSLHGISQNEPDYAKYTFYSNRVINGHSSETTPGGKLEFSISHRMGRINQGAYELFGLDQSTSKLSLEYGLNDRLMAGIGRSTVEKLFDGFLKYRILRQSTGKVNMPMSLTGFASIAVNSLKWTDPTKKDFFTSRLFYTYQLIAARKFSEKLSLQLVPTFIHRNLVQLKTDKNDVLAFGLGGKYNISNRIAITCEYYYVLPGQIKSQYNSSDVVNSFSAGIDIFTGKHTFQIFITNSTSMSEKSFITETTDKWNKGNIHIGFNIQRLFTIVNK